MLTKIRYWTIDYIHMFRGQLVSYLHRSPSAQFNKTNNNDTFSVVIIPGILEKWSFMKQLADIIAENGHDVYVVPKLGSNLLSIPESAALVNELINEKDLSNVVLLAHSKGGLIGKYLIINNNEDRRIKKLIAIATPFSGSTRGKLVPHKALKELLPTSELIKELQSNIEVNKDIISITPMHDNHIIAPTGSFLDGATNIRVDVSGHHRVLYDKAVISKILELFKFE